MEEENRTKVDGLDYNSNECIIEDLKDQQIYNYVVTKNQHLLDGI